jgi:hypothetical protein
VSAVSFPREVLSPQAASISLLKFKPGRESQEQMDLEGSPLPSWFLSQMCEKERVYRYYGKVFALIRWVAIDARGRSANKSPGTIKTKSEQDQP